MGQVSTSSKRLFLGIQCVENSDLRAFEKNILLKLKITAERKGIEVKWVPLRNYHVTVKFFGDVDAKGEQLIVEGMQRISDHGLSSFGVKIRQMGAFPDVMHARVLWLGVQRKTDFVKLFEASEEVFAAAGFARESRDFAPHLTIGRIRKTRNVKDLISPFVRKDFAKVEVKHLVLFHSKVHGPYPVYEPLHSIEL